MQLSAKMYKEAFSSNVPLQPNYYMEVTMLSCHDVARYFLTKVDSDVGDLVSNLNLQKLVYYAQGLHLAIYDESLFPESIEAWQYGPVAPALYQAYKEYGSGAIERPLDVDFSLYDERTRSFLDEVYSFFGQFSAIKLANMTHEEDPWKKAPTNGVINLQSMKEYFRAWLKQYPERIKAVSISPQAEIVQKFEALAKKWELEVAGSSFVAEKYSHPAYQQIIAMGSAVIPLLLRELEQKPNHWFEALRTITGANPIQPEQRGRTKQMAQAWLKWGREHGYEW